MNKSKIEWCDYTWNPVTGCLHGCGYCYARRIVKRFSDWCFLPGGRPVVDDNEKIGGLLHDIKRPYTKNFPDEGGPIQPYPFGFEPSFHRYSLDEPKQKAKGVKIFVSSMGDLFGDWVPDEWIDEVMKAITKAPQHQYLFLTKNPSRYWDYVFGSMNEIPPEYDFSKVKMMFGTTVTKQEYVEQLLHYNGDMIDFLSVEPLLGEIDLQEILEMQPCCMEEKSIKWIIVGAQTGPGAVQYKPEWVQSIIGQARAARVPIFLKDNLKWPEKIQELPDGLCHGSI